MAEIVTPPAAADAASIGANDPSLVSGQDPGNLFGIAISYDSGAPGTAGANAQPEGDPTNEPGQYPATEPISGVSLSEMSGAPGGPAADPDNRPGEQSFMITDPNGMAGRPGGGSGNYFIPADVAVGGGGDSTTMPGQYGSGVADAMPSMAQPMDTGAGRGRVMRGGWMKGQR
jgi:hypothetical protein